MALTELFGDIADAIREKDGTTAAIAATAFPARIREIGPAPVTPPDPAQLRAAGRPADWLEMPEPQDDELYLLVHIPDGVSGLLAFTVTCTGSYSVALGSVSGGAFAAQGGAVSLQSGAKYETELSAASFGDLTADGMKQCMVKVSGTAVKTWEPSTHSKKTTPSNFVSWSIMEIACRLPQGTKVALRHEGSGYQLRKLRYFSWKGANAMTTAGSMFKDCYSLTAVPALDTSKVTGMSSMFNNCYRLAAIPALDTSKVTDMGGMFKNCYSLTALPALDTSKVTTMGGLFGGAFEGCNSLLALPPLDTSRVTDMGRAFYGCYCLSAITALDTSKATNMNYMVNVCNSLAKITLKPTVTGWAGAALSLSGCSLGHQALVDLFNSLPAIANAKNLTLTGNPGVPELTDAEKAIATGKCMSLVLL